MRSWLNNRKVGSKLYFILILAVLTIWISNALLIYQLSVTSSDIERELYDELYFSTLYLLNADRDFYQADQAFTRLLMNHGLSADAATSVRKDYEENIGQVKERMTLAKQILLADDGLNSTKMEEYFNQFYDRFSAWEEETGQLLAQSHSQNTAVQANKLRDDFEATRQIIDLIQEDLEGSALQMIEAIHSKNKQLIITSTSVMFLAMFIIFLLGFLLIRSMTKPITKLVHTFQQVSNGNLQVEDMSLNRHDEIGQLAAASNIMITHLRTMVEKMQQIARAVSQQGGELTRITREVSLGAEQVAATMEELSAGAEEQASSAIDMSALLENLKNQITRANEDGQALEHTSKEVYQLSNTGMEEMAQLAELMDELTRVVTESVNKVKVLDQRSEEISKLIVVIQEIAEQTNLLALNAAIEAARAGETGQGFAVVANEVRKLAEQVGESVQEITGIINGVQEDTTSMVDALESGYQKVEAGNQQLYVSRDSFVTINKGVSGMLERIQHLSTSLNDIDVNADKVGQSVNEIAAVSEESAAGIEESSATAEQQSAAMQEVAASVEALSKLAEDLNELIQQFKL